MRRLLISLAILVCVGAAQAAVQEKTYIDTEYTVGGITSCTAAQCTKCGNDAKTGAVICVKVSSSSSCECKWNNAECTGSGTCTYKP